MSYFYTLLHKKGFSRRISLIVFVLSGSDFENFSMKTCQCAVCTVPGLQSQEEGHLPLIFAPASARFTWIFKPTPVNFSNSS